MSYIHFPLTFHLGMKFAHLLEKKAKGLVLKTHYATLKKAILICMILVTLIPFGFKEWLPEQTNGREPGYGPS